MVGIPGTPSGAIKKGRDTIGGGPGGNPAESRPNSVPQVSVDVAHPSREKGVRNLFLKNAKTPHFPGGTRKRFLTPFSWSRAAKSRTGRSGCGRARMPPWSRRSAPAPAPAAQQATRRSWPVSRNSRAAPCGRERPPARARPEANLRSSAAIRPAANARGDKYCGTGTPSRIGGAGRFCRRRLQSLPPAGNRRRRLHDCRNPSSCPCRRRKAPSA